MTNSQTVAAISAALSVALDALAAAQAALPTLTQAQAEGWTPDDPRWTAPFVTLDDALKAAAARLT